MKRILIAVACATACACSKSDTKPAAQPSRTIVPSSAQTTRVSGRVASGALAVAVLEPKTARQFPDQGDKPVMDQVGLTFGPEMLVVRTGQPVEFRNSDDTLHNVNVKHEDTREQAFNVAIPTGQSYDYTFKRDGFYHVGCDIHPAMSAEIFAASTPYTVVAGSDGSFAFDDVPAGDWALTVYTAGKQIKREVTVKAGEQLSVGDVQ